MSRHHHHHQSCPHCRASLPAPRSRLMGNLVITLAWLVVLAESFGVVLIGPFILMVIPFTFAAGVSLISAAHEWAEREWTCDACGKLIELEPATHAPAAAPELHPARAA